MSVIFYIIYTLMRKKGNEKASDIFNAIAFFVSYIELFITYDIRIYALYNYFKAIIVYFCICNVYDLMHEGNSYNRDEMEVQCLLFMFVYSFMFVARLVYMRV